MDQILANELGKETQLPSLELGMESAETAGACDTGYACPYTSDHRLEERQHAAADAEQPARRVRAAVRRYRHHRSQECAWRGCSSSAASSTR